MQRSRFAEVLAVLACLLPMSTTSAGFDHDEVGNVATNPDKGTPAQSLVVSNLRCSDDAHTDILTVAGLALATATKTHTTPNRERQCIGCWLCESPTRRSHSERQCKVVQIRVLVGDAWVRTYSFQADFKAITYQSPCDAVHALVPEEWSARVSTTVLPM